MLRRKIIEILINLLEKELSDIPKERLNDTERNGLLAQLWQNAAFRQYVAERNEKIVYALAGGDGMQPEDRDKYLMHAGQRVENLILANKAKVAFKIIEDALTKERMKSASPQA